jgi:hypothetical protein
MWLWLLLVLCVLPIDARRTTFLLCPTAEQTLLLEQLLQNVSDPYHPQYLQFLSLGEVNARFSPPATVGDRVSSWLSTHPDVINVIKRTRYQIAVEHRTDTVSMDAAPAGAVCGTHRAGDGATGRRRDVQANTPPVGAGVYNIISAQTFQSVYNTPNPLTYTRLNQVRDVKLMVVDLSAKFDASDLRATAHLTGTTTNYDGFDDYDGTYGFTSGTELEESVLDLSMITAVSPVDTQLIYYDYDNVSNDWWWNSFYSVLEGTAPFADIMSYSWASLSNYPGWGFAYYYIQLVTLNGTTIFASSGDNGAYGLNPTCGGYGAQYPSASPHVTAVGASAYPGYNSYYTSSLSPLCSTTYTIGELAIMFNFSTSGYQSTAYFQCVEGLTGSEVAPSGNFYSGGGFAAPFPIPSWQISAVGQYLASGVPFPNSSFYNASQRGLPDISMYGNGGFPYVQGTDLMGYGGTSQAAPVMAALCVYLTDWSLANLGKPLGSINPLLYAMWEADYTIFNDITQGNNAGIEGGTCPEGGFSCAPGWDAVTGLGTPNIGRMIAWMSANLLPSSSTGRAAVASSSSSPRVVPSSSSSSSSFSSTTPQRAASSSYPGTSSSRTQTSSHSSSSYSSSPPRVSSSPPALPSVSSSSSSSLDSAHGESSSALTIANIIEVAVGAFVAVSAVIIALYLLRMRQQNRMFSSNRLPDQTHLLPPLYNR